MAKVVQLTDWQADRVASATYYGSLPDHGPIVRWEGLSESDRQHWGGVASVAIARYLELIEHG